MKVCALLIGQSKQTSLNLANTDNTQFASTVVSYDEMTTDLNCRRADKKKSACCSFPLGSNFVRSSAPTSEGSRSTGARAAGGAWPELRLVPVALDTLSESQSAFPNHE